MMNNLTKEQQALLLLIRRSLWGEKINLPADVDWEKVDIMAKEQGVTTMAYDGLRHLNVEVPQHILQKWKRVLITAVTRNEVLMRAQDDVLRWFAEGEIPAAILKGTSVARYYPQPDLRALGDIDILVSKKNLESACQILERNGYTMYENDPGYHISFKGASVAVELHYDVTALPDSVGGKRMERVTEKFMSDISCGKIGQRQFPTLSDSNQAVALLLHMIRHMFGSHIGLRQLCDWAMYMANTDMAEFENHTVPGLAYGGILYYAKVATRACVEYLGLSEAKAEWCKDIKGEECQLFISDIFHGGSMGAADREGMGSLFTNSRAMGTKESSLTAFFLRLTKRCYYHYPFVEKYKILLPVFVLIIPIRYLLLLVLGLRPKKDVFKAVRSAQKRRKLYEMLNLFESEVK